MNLLDSTTEFMRLARQLDDPPTFNDKSLSELRRRLLAEEYTEYENGGHDQTRAMTDPELWRWLLGQRRSARK